jgi:hypothetical protein
MYIRREKEDPRLSWEETYKAMAEEQENWEDFDQTLLDGLERDNKNAAQLRRLITEMYGE